MKTITEITLKTHEERDLSYEINNHKLNISNYTRDLKFYTKEIIDKEYNINYCTCMLDVFSTTSSMPSEYNEKFIKEWKYYEDLIQVDDTHTILCSLRIDTVSRSIRKLKRELRIANKQLKLLQASPNIININDIKILLSSNKNIILDSVHFPILHNDKDNWLSFVFTGLRCSPDENPYFNLIDNDFPLGDVLVHINLDTKKIILLPNSDIPLPRSNSGYRIHPHVLTDNEPCFGDFQGNIVEALDDYEWDTAVSVIQLFLEQSYNSDQAGKYWPRFMIKACDPEGLSELSNFNKKAIGMNTFYGRKYVSPNGREYLFDIPFVRDGKMEMLTGTYEEVKKFIANNIH